MHSITLDTIAAPGVFPGETLIRAGKRKVVLICQFAWVLLLAAASLLAPVIQVDTEQLVYPICMAFTLSFIWILWSWFVLRGTLFEPYSLFVVTAGLFNGGQAVLEVFGMNTTGMLNGRVSPEILAPALMLVTAGLNCVHLGALLALGLRNSREIQSPDTEARKGATRLVGWLLLGVAIVPSVMRFKNSFDLVLDYGYLGLYRPQTNISVSVALSALFVPGLIFVLAGSKGKPAIQAVCFAILTLHAASNLFLGARGLAGMSVLAMAWVFDRSIRRIPRWILLAGVLAAFVMFALIRETRDMEGRNRLSVESQLEVLGGIERPVSSSVSEMGYSLITVTHTLSLVPQARPFDWGVSYLYALAAVVPNIGWDIHPSVAHGLLSEWLINTVDPVVANYGGGLGFSFIAEAYLNFGWYGGPLWLGIIGIGLGWLFLKADSHDPALHALVGSFLSFFFVFARGEAAIVARGLVWYAVLPFLLVTALTLSGHQREKDKCI